MADADSASKGAAEEPEPEPGPPSGPSSSSVAAPYDPREYQPPHPDDRGGGDSGKATKKKGKAKSKLATAKGGADSAKSKAAEDDDGAHRCGNCDAPDAKRKCKGCGVESYCNRECQTVGLGRR